MQSASEDSTIERENFQNNNKDQPAAPKADFTNFRKRLLGLGANEVLVLLGVPFFQRKEPPAEIWQYRSLACVVDVFLYESEGDLGVEYVEARGRDKEKVDENVCFGSVLKKVLPSLSGSIRNQYTRVAGSN